MCSLALSHFSWNEALDSFLADAAQGGDWLPATPRLCDSITVATLLSQSSSYLTRSLAANRSIASLRRMEGVM